MVSRTPRHGYPIPVVVLLPGAGCSYAGSELLRLKLTRCEQWSSAGVAREKLKKGERQVQGRGRLLNLKRRKSFRVLDKLVGELVLHNSCHTGALSKLQLLTDKGLLRASNFECYSPASMADPLASGALYGGNKYYRAPPRPSKYASAVNSETPSR
ncbi:hypothetical protein NDU88_009435 [Pleurodeles waltl]|uniref:Uncharacterized protein n=1 Tax=Pleurodeles waltl TaxID=8319 RepID=A0AAV7QTM1_PLEWA|nr:hypothetical protein NDU88_009435 [Pleurodeles waltl]